MKLQDFLLFISALLPFTSSNLLSPGIVRKEVTVTQKKVSFFLFYSSNDFWFQIEYYGFFQSALNGSEVEIRMNCENDILAQYSVQYVLRSTPCAKEFTDKTRLSKMNNMLVC